MKVQLPEDAIEIIKKVRKGGKKIYIVGGAVRDILMDKPVHDWDFTTDAIPEDLLKVLSDKDAYYTNEFGTVGIPSESKDLHPYEITTFRTEREYKDFRRPSKVEWGKTLEEDVLRRDFTINALVLEYTGTGVEFLLIDLVNGQKDLDNRVIRAVGDPQDRFSEDALRMMRAVRIAGELRFSIEKNTLEAIKVNASLINKISRERVKEELFKIIGSPYPYEGMQTLRDTGLMQEILPEMEKTFGVEQKSPGRHHIYDVGTHSMLALKHVAEITKDPVTRFATLIHDIGKPQTYKKLDNGTITFYNHEVISTKIASRISERLRFSREETDKLTKLVRWHQFSVDERQTDSAIRRFIRRVGIEYVEDMLALRVGDRLGGGARETSWRLEDFKKRLVEVQKQPFEISDLKINGTDVMKALAIKPGPKVGEILRNIFKQVETKKIENDRVKLLEKLDEFKS